MSLPRHLASRVFGRNRERKPCAFMRTFRLDSTFHILDVGVDDHERCPHENYLEQHYPWRAD